MRTRVTAAAVAVAVAAIAVGGCGSSGSPSRTTADGSSAGSAVVRAADVTGATSGYRFTATLDITGAATIRDTLRGTILRASNKGAIELRQHLLGRFTKIDERFAGRTYWISAASIPDASKLTSKPWLRYNIGATLSELGLGGLPSGSSSSDPSQYLAYLKGAGARTRRLGTATVDGVPTTRYAATVNLHDYVRRVPAGQRAQARKSVQRLISTIGSDALHVQVWIDDHHLARRISLSFPECVGNEHLHLSMVVDMFDFGTNANVALPSASRSYDITSLVDRELANQTLGCTSGS
jgi:hypothetical protein